MRIQLPLGTALYAMPTTIDHVDDLNSSQVRDQRDSKLYSFEATDKAESKK